MLALPAIDLLNGKVVRLAEGSFQSVTIYADDPVDLLEEWAEFGVKKVHVVDLNAAKGEGNNAQIIQKMAEVASVKLQLGGGLRSLEAVKSAFDRGVDTVVVGTAAVMQPDFLKACAEQFSPQRIVLGLDLKKGQIMVHGWMDAAPEPLNDFVLRSMGLGYRNFLCTDVARDGMLQGPAFKLYEELLHDYPTLHLIASGGVRDLDDLKRLRKSRLNQAVVGRAIYEGTLDIEDIVEFNPKA
jgi:phosphoribosylformimino-5-aminoimidazole carboxamide ribotide isomerase